MSKEKDSKNNEEKIIQFKGIKKNGTFWASIVLLAIMILSIVGFVASSTGGGTGGDGNLPSEVPFQQFQDPNSGQVFWGAIRNDEQFIFMNITGFDNSTELANLAGLIKTKESVNIYVDETFNSGESIYLINKGLRGLEIMNVQSNSTQCGSNDLILTTNNTYQGSCMVFSPNKGEEFKQTENLLYFLVQ